LRGIIPWLLALQLLALGCSLSGGSVGSWLLRSIMKARRGTAKHQAQKLEARSEELIASSHQIRNDTNHHRD
jgi:hypothetical protein